MLSYLLALGMNFSTVNKLLQDVARITRKVLGQTNNLHGTACLDESRPTDLTVLVDELVRQSMMMTLLLF